MKTSINKIAIIQIIAGLLVLTGGLILLPIQEWLTRLIQDEFVAEYTALLLKMSIILTIGYKSISTLKIQKTAGLSNNLPWGFKVLNLIPVYLFVLGILSVIGKDLASVSIPNVVLLLAACLTVGFAEEFVFRGVIQSLLLKKIGMRKNGVFLSILFSSLLFGAFHLLNLFKVENQGQVLVQVAFATFIGFFFGALLLKTNKLIPIALTHGLINFFFSLSILPAIKIPENEVAETPSLAPIVLFFPLFVAGILIYRNLNKNRILDQINP